MKMNFLNIALSALCLLLPLGFSARAQGTFIFVYDQQSADENTGGGAAGSIQKYQPIGQSFTPTFPSVGFIRLNFGDANPGNNLGATVYVNLRANSITGTILGSTDPVFMPDNFGRGSNGVANFFFSTPVTVAPGVTYFLQPVLQSGDSTWAIVGYNYYYPGGNAIFKGLPSGNDLWFREGIVVPEPAAWVLLLLGGGALVWRTRKFQ